MSSFGAELYPKRSTLHGAEVDSAWARQEHVVPKSWFGRRAVAGRLAAVSRGQNAGPAALEIEALLPNSLEAQMKRTANFKR